MRPTTRRERSLYDALSDLDRINIPADVLRRSKFSRPVREWPGDTSYRDLLSDETRRNLDEFEAERNEKLHAKHSG